MRADARSLLADVPPRSYAVQHREDDLSFIERLLAEEGLGYSFVEGDGAPAGRSTRSRSSPTLTRLRPAAR